MELSDIYELSVSKTNIPICLNSKPTDITFQRDQSLVKLEQTLFTQMSDIVADELQVIEIHKKTNSSNNVETVSFEQALKELLTAQIK
jgi:hypothetical protein